MPRHFAAARLSAHSSLLEDVTIKYLDSEHQFKLFLASLNTTLPRGLGTARWPHPFLGNRKPKIINVSLQFEVFFTLLTRVCFILREPNLCFRDASNYYVAAMIVKYSSSGGSWLLGDCGVNQQSLHLVQKDMGPL